MRNTSRSRVLVVEDLEADAKLLMRGLADAGYTNLVHRHDVASATAEITANPPRLVILDLRRARLGGVELTKHIRTLDQAAYIYVVVLTSSASDAVVGSCFDAGIDDFVEEPCRPEEIVSRLRAGERILALETSLRTKSRELETALRRIDVVGMQRALAKVAEVVDTTLDTSDAAPLDALLATQTWRDGETLLLKAMTDFFQLPFAMGRARDELSEPFVAEVSLSEPTKQLELGLSVVVDTPSMKRLGAHLLGDEDLEGAQALVLEVANILMGTLKTAFTAYGFTFTGGIPTSESFAHTRMTFDRAQIRSRMAIAAGDSEVELWLRLREKKNTIMLGRELTEGLVVSEDIHDADGLLIMKSGSRLTHTSVGRLAKLVPDREITVSDPNS